MKCIECKEIIKPANNETGWEHLGNVMKDHLARPNPVYVNCEHCDGNGACPKCGGMGEHAPAKTVRVRIAIAIDVNGNWNACGYKIDNESKQDAEANMRDLAIEGTTTDPTLIFWLEADLPIPQETAIEATVTGEEKV